MSSFFFRLPILVHRKRNLGFQFLLSAAAAAKVTSGVREQERSDMSSNQRDASKGVNKIANGLVLYYSQYSFYSQKVNIILF